LTTTPLLDQHHSGPGTDLPRGPTAFRNVQANGRVALVVDDLVSQDPWTVRGLEIRGTAVALHDVDPPVPFMSREVIRITPTWVASWGVDPQAPARRSRRS
jgi:pyridoxamine 5'-phosphate oxidase family protein